ncbi:hypothetical protein [Rhodopseudomonas palustris]
MALIRNDTEAKPPPFAQRSYRWLRLIARVDAIYRSDTRSAKSDGGAR